MPHARFRLHCLLIASLCALLPTLLMAQGHTVRGPYTVHYSALPSTVLLPDVARASGVTRSSSRGLLNIAVLQDIAGTPTAVTALVEAAATNANGQRQSLRMREVREGDAIYYLGEPRISAGDRLDFEVSVTPLGASEPVLLRFTQSFHP